MTSKIRIERKKKRKPPARPDAPPPEPSAPEATAEPINGTAQSLSPDGHLTHTLDGPIVKDGEKYLSHTDLLALRVADLSVENARLRFALSQTEKRLMNAQAAIALTEKVAEMRALREKAHEQEGHGRDFSKAVRDAYGIDGGMTYDDETGLIREGG